MAKTLFDLTVDDRMYSDALKFFGSKNELLFEASERDTTMYSVLMPEIDSCKRNDLKILRIELMHFVFAYIDFLLMRSTVLHERFHTALCFETVRWYVQEFRKRIEPIGRSEEFLAASESRMRAYNEAWDQLFADANPPNRILIEQVFFRFCEPRVPVTNLMLYLALQRELTAMSLMILRFFEIHKLRK